MGAKISSIMIGMAMFNRAGMGLRVTARRFSLDLSALKLNSNGLDHLYAVFKLHNMPYLVTKGDKVYLPFKLKHAAVGDSLTLNQVTTLGLPDYTYNNDQGIDPKLYTLTAQVLEITREPYREVIRKKQRCRRVKTFPVEPFQTVLTINELKLN